MIAADNGSVTFKYKDYRADGSARYKLMTLAAEEFIHRFLLHVLPAGFHRIRHYGLFAKSSCAENIARARALLNVAGQNQTSDTHANDDDTTHSCPHCGGRMIIIETFQRGQMPRHRPSGPMIAIRIDTS